MSGREGRNLGFLISLPQVLTLTGSARLFQTRWLTLTALDGFEEAWSAFLSIIKECSCSDSSEVRGHVWVWLSCFMMKISCLSIQGCHGSHEELPHHRGSGGVCQLSLPEELLRLTPQLRLFPAHCHAHQQPGREHTVCSHHQRNRAG